MYPVIAFMIVAMTIIACVGIFYKGDVMSPAQKREALKKSYPGPKWADKVDKMSDKQVHATYMRLLNNKQL